MKKILLALLLISNIILGQNYVYWTGGGTTNNWCDEANWSTGYLPQPNEIAVFSNLSSKTCLVNCSILVGGLECRSNYVGTIMQTGYDRFFVKGNITVNAGYLDFTNGNVKVQGTLAVDKNAYFYMNTGRLIGARVDGLEGNISESDCDNARPTTCNLIINGGLEDYISLPDNLPTFTNSDECANNAPDDQETVKSSCSWFSGSRSTDYFLNVTDSKLKPGDFTGSSVRNGLGMFGTYGSIYCQDAASGCGTELTYREIFGQLLFTPLVIDRKYIVSYYTRLSPGSGIAKSGQGYMFLSRVAANFEGVIRPEAYKDPRIIDSPTDWTQIGNIYTATGNERVIYIGNFALNSERLTKSLSKTQSRCYSYNLIDDISVVPLPFTNIGGDKSICNSLSVIIGPTNNIPDGCTDLNFQWKEVSGTTETEISIVQNPTVSPSVTTDYKLYINGFYFDKVTVNVNINAPIAAPVKICSSDRPVVINIDVLGTPPFTIVMNGVTYTSNTNKFTITKAYTDGAQYTITSLTNGNGCTINPNTVIPVTIDPTVKNFATDVTINTTSTTVPYGSVINLNSFITIYCGSIQPTDLVWKDANGTVVNPSFVAGTPGTYTLYSNTGMLLGSITINILKAEITPSVSKTNYCIGDNLTLTAAPSGATYSWYSPSNSLISTGQSVVLTNLGLSTPGGIYTVYVTKNGITSSATFNVIVGGVAVPVITPATPICFLYTGGSVTFSVSNTSAYPAGTTYKWWIDGITNAQQQPYFDYFMTVNPATHDDYPNQGPTQCHSIIVRVYINGCASNQNNKDYVFSTGCPNNACSGARISIDNEESDLSTYSLFPNPSNGQFTFNKNSEGPVDIEIYDVLGQKIYTQNGIEATNTEINLTDRSIGIYQLKISKIGEKPKYLKLIRSY